MENSHRFFENKDCKYFPCHEGLGEFNCMFCYCPLYHKEHCSGKPNYIEKNGKQIKVCKECVFPHCAENYDAMIQMLKE